MPFGENIKYLRFQFKAKVRDGATTAGQLQTFVVLNHTDLN
jgi:hypothetical protein